jgi:NADH-quinone oxidoreductase subunit F
MPTVEYNLLRHRIHPNLDQLSVYLEQGGFRAFRKALMELKPDQVLQEVKASGLRGRGGAGFPTGVKWSFLPNTVWPHYVVCNADESEPGTFKDREIMEKNPFQLLEGVMLAAYAVQAQRAYIYLRGEFWKIAQELDKRILDLESAGFLGDNLLGTAYSLRLHTHLGAGAYICGEESALLESMEGKLGQPRLRPPFPANYGLFGKPTVINNVETLANVPLIIERGAAWFRTFGTERSPGTKIFSLSGCVNRPGNYELPLGTSFRKLIYELGEGISGGRAIKAILPAGASSSIIRPTEEILDTPMDYESVAAIGSMLGSASVIVLDDSIDMRWLIQKTVHFFRHESCGKCTPCREGTYWMDQLARRIVTGSEIQANVALLRDVADEIRNKCLCPLGEFSITGVATALDKYGEDFLDRKERIEG